MSDWEWRILRTGTRGKYRQVERRMIVEYITRHCANAITYWIHKRLGPTRQDVVAAVPGLPHGLYRVYNPYADAVCVWPDRIEIYEFKVHDPFKGVAQLQYYRVLAQQDPELMIYKDKPIVPILVHWRHLPDLEALCKANGIVYVVYYPSWLEPILREYGYGVR